VGDKKVGVDTIRIKFKDDESDGDIQSKYKILIDGQEFTSAG